MFGLVLSVTQQVWLKPLGLVDTRWVVASLCGVCFLSLLAPNVWFAAFLLASALSVPLSLVAFHKRILKEVGAPTYGVIALLQVGVWIAATTLVSHAIQGWVEPFLAVLIACAVYTNVLGFLQVYCGIGRAKRIAYGPIGEPLNEPLGCLHTVWRPACLNAMLIPVALALAIDRPIPISSLYVAAAITMFWHLYATNTTTALIATVAGLGACILSLHYYLILPVFSPLALVAYPSIRSGMTKDPRWEVWSILWSRVKADHFIGRGMGAWAGADVRGTVESERIWLWAHSEWLEALYDCGPVPVLIALGFVCDATWKAVVGGVSTLQAGVFGGLIALAVVSAGYMPFRTWPLNLVGIGLLAAWLA
jgi:hypothetical protein